MMVNQNFGTMGLPQQLGCIAYTFGFVEIYAEEQVGVVYRLLCCIFMSSVDDNLPGCWQPGKEVRVQVRNDHLYITASAVAQP